MKPEVFYINKTVDLGEYNRQYGKHDYIHPNANISYALKSETKAVIEFLIDSASEHIIQELKRKYGLNLKDIDICIFEDNTSTKFKKLNFIAYYTLNNYKNKIIITQVEFPCTKEIIDRCLKRNDFYVYMALKIQEIIRNNISEHNSSS